MLFDIRSVLRVMMAMTYFFFGNNFIYLFLAVLDLCCDTGLSPAVVRLGLLCHSVQTAPCPGSSCGAEALGC